MYAARTIGADRGKEVVAAETDKGIFEFAAIACEEDCARARSIAYAEYVALLEDWTKGGCGKRVIVAFITAGVVGDGVTAQAG
jgi:hypothetical protein